MSWREGRSVAGRSSLKPSPGTIAWLAVPVLVSAVVLVFCVSGLYIGGPAGLVAFALCALASVTLIARRERARDAIGTLLERLRVPERWRGAALTALVVLACAVGAFFSLEVAYADGGALAVRVPYALLEIALIGLLLLVLLFVCQRSGAGLAAGVLICAVIGIAQYFVADFKSSVIMPSDLLVLGTAAAVAGSYVYEVSDQILISLGVALVAVGVASLLAPARPLARRRVAGNLGAAVACAVLLAAAVLVPSYADDLGVSVSGWNPLSSYRSQGFLPSFVKVGQDMVPEAPEGYTDEQALELESTYAAAYDETVGATEERATAEAQFAEALPSLVVIVDESFCDLTQDYGDDWGYAGPQYYNAIDDAVMRGTLTVSTYGGGTCNTEFELLTGISLGFVGEGTYPFSFYDLSNTASLPRQLAALGYETTAMHPNLATNYNRSIAYPSLGFDTFLSIDDFEGAEQYHSGVTDEETFDRVLEILETSDAPQLIYDLTMQNHSAYDQDNLGDVPQYTFEGLDEGGCEQLSEYLACIEETDHALEEFLAELEQLDRPVAVLFLGDHQSYVSTWMNDAAYPDEEEPEHSLRLYETTYVLWANYDLAGSAQSSEEVDASASNLVALALNALGAPLTDFQKAQVVTHGELSALSVMGVRDGSGNWITLDDEETLPAVYDDLRRMAYLEFARVVEGT